MHLVLNLKKLRSVYVALLIATVALTNAKAQINMPPSFVHSLVSVGWDNPVGITYDANGRSYVWERSGKVWIVDTNNVRQTNPLIDISDEVGNWRAHGMLGFALDPNFLTNGYIYLYYAVDRYALFNMGLPNYKTNKSITNNASIGRITRYTANAASGFTTVNKSSRLVLLGETKSTGIPILHQSHGVGSLVFGRDGSLLASAGDGASYSVVDTGSAYGTYWAQALLDSIITPKENIGNLRAQLVDCLNGKILRLNPANGNGLPSNPFYDATNPRAAKSRVWAVGLRNPFRIALQPNTGSTDITAGQPGTIMQCEVGWATWEETNRITHGGMNLGWPFYEGINAVPDFAASRIANMDAPNPLYGNGVCTQPYFYFNDLIKQASLNSATAVFKNPCDTSRAIPATIPVFIHTPPVLTWHHDIAVTQVPLLIVDSTIAQNVGGTSGVSGLPFAGNCSVAGTFYNNNKFPINYQGSFFNADYGENWIKQFSFNAAGELTALNPFADSVGAIVYLTVNPKSGCLVYVTLPDAVHQICYTANVNLPPTAKIALTDTVNYGASPLTLHFNGLLSTDPENAIATYNWNFGDGTNASGNTVAHTYTSGLVKSFSVILTVTDSTGQKGYDSIIVSINNTPPQVHITSPVNGSYYPTAKQSVVNCIANVTDAEQADASLVYNWITILHHNNHTHPEPTDHDHITTTILSTDGCDELYYYEQRLTVTDPAGLSTTDTVFLYPRCAVPDISFDADKTSICVGDTVHFTNTSFNGLNYQWNFNGGIVISSNQNNATVCYPTDGNYSVSLKACNSIGCDTLIKASWIHVDNYTVSITASGNTTICFGDSTLLTAVTSAGSFTAAWYLNNVAIAGANSLSYLAKQSGNYMVRITLAGGCSKTSSSITVTVLPPIITTLTSNKLNTICYGDTATFSLVSQTGATYGWFKNGTLITGATASTYKASTTGNYNALITIGNCFAQTANFNLKVSPDVTLSVTKYVICNDSALLSVPYALKSKYVWKKDGTAIPGIITNYYYAKQPAKYFVTVRDSLNCLRSSNKVKIKSDCRELADVVYDDESIQNLLVKPNPANETATLNFDALSNQQIKIMLVDFTGQLVYTDNVEVKEGENEYQFALSGLCNGLYQIIIDNKSITKHLKLAVVH